VPRRRPTTRQNGLRTFALHALAPDAAPVVAKLGDDRPRQPAFALPATADLGRLDAETAARRYLDQALKSDAVPAFVAPATADAASEFKTIGTETIPLTGTRTVKFRQTLNKIPVYGSLVTIELDDANGFVSLNSSLGNPAGVSPIATISPAAAVRAVRGYPGYQKDLAGVVPRPHYYFDSAAAKWRLVFILEDVAIRPRGSRKSVSPFYADYVVDAHTGRVVAELPRTPSAAASTVEDSAADGRGVMRTFKVQQSGKTRTLKDASLNVQTFDFRFDDPQRHESLLPGKAITQPPPWPPSAVSAHANASAVAAFLRDVFGRNNIDNKGGPMRSSINCVVARESEDGQEWLNAFWNGEQMVYGQRWDGKTLLSMSVELDVVGHEMFHGVTDFTARLEYANQSGALNESFSDIFGVVIANWENADPRKWNWTVGEGLSPDGRPFRDMQNPARYGQPDHMRGYRTLPNNGYGDWGGVHINSGIHNKAAYLMLIAADASDALVLTPRDVAALFYLSVTQQLSRTSQFADSRRAAILSARTLFRTLPAAVQQAKLDAVAGAFEAVGIR
jgi:Zn-dependent metalloprotease